MRYINTFSFLTRTIIISTVGCLLYGYLCRLLHLYFFWESKTLGWMLFWVMIIALLRERIKIKKSNNKNVVGEKIGIGFSAFVLLIQIGLFIGVRQTLAYENAVNFIKNNSSIEDEVGKVSSAFLTPYGGISMSENSRGQAGEADLHFIVKGSRKYIDLNLLMNKEFDTGWQIQINE